MWKNFNVKIIVILLLIPILKVLTILIHTYFKDLLKVNRKSDTNTNKKVFKKTGSEGVIKETDELLVGSASGRAKLNGA